MVKIHDKFDEEDDLTCREFVKKYGRVFYRFNSWRNPIRPEQDYDIETDGNAENIWELMVLMMLDRDSDTRFIHFYESFPEDFIEGRTEYSELKEYATDMKRFIERALCMLSDIA